MGFVASQATDMTQIGAQIQAFFQHAATVADSQTSTLASYHNDTLNESLTITGDNMTQFVGFPAMGTIYTIEFDAPIGTVAYTFSFSNFVIPVHFDQDFFADLLAGGDTITGSAFNDVLIGGAGHDTLDGGDGIDTVDYSKETDSVFVILNGATDAGVSINLIPADTVRNIENVIGGSGDDHLTGDDGNNAFYGGGGDDVLTGGEGTDVLNGGADNDTLIGGLGPDVLDGGSGIDTASYAEAASAVILNFVTEVHGGEAAGDQFDSIERFVLSPFNDRFTGDTQPGDVDTVFAGAGNDVLTGGNGTEIYFGEAGNDTLKGGAGKDTLTGGLGRDKLTGGAGRDIFDFNSVSETKKGAANRDVITDFHHGNNVTGDDIDLHDIDANTHKGGNQAFHFIGSQAFHSHGTHHVYGELHYKNHVLSGDVNGDGKADFEIHVNASSLAKGDFIL
jgi:Ca2+-binding RTX toxin-like protein